ncbi:MAG: hypothetical protein HC941_27020 [Microcoleus sp. SU_5_3]|nr:hypothetical protein [Microcoleus sp. SU_5_3]NJL69904.1 hypothetical protein [Microcoleus sp. SM1_3_4]
MGLARTALLVDITTTNLKRKKGYWKERSPVAREKVVKGDRPFHTKKSDRPFHTKKSDRPFHTKRAIDLFMKKERSTFL